MPLDSRNPTPNDSWTIMWPSGPDNSAITQKTWYSIVAPFPWNATNKGHVYFMGLDTSVTPSQSVTLHDEDFTLSGNVPKVWEVPANTSHIVTALDHPDQEVGWALEILAK